MIIVPGRAFAERLSISLKFLGRMAFQYLPQPSRWPAIKQALHLICNEDSVGTTSLYDLASATNLSMNDALAVSEARLLSAAKRGQQAAFGKLCERHAKRIYMKLRKNRGSREIPMDELAGTQDESPRLSR